MKIFFSSAIEAQNNAMATAFYVLSDSIFNQFSSHLTLYVIISQTVFYRTLVFFEI